MKKTGRKVIAATMATAMIAMMGTGSAFAATVTNVETPATESTEVKYSVTASYEWSVPSEIDFGSNQGVGKTEVKGTVKSGEENKVSVKKNVIAHGKKLQITAAGSGESGAFSITNGTDVLNYSLKAADKDIETSGVVLSVNAGTNTGEAALTFTLSTAKSTAEVVGEYEGTVTYTASVVDQ